MAEARGRLRGAATLKVLQEAHLIALYCAGEHSVAKLGDLLRVARTTVYT